MLNTDAADRQLQLLRLMLLIVGAALGVVGWYRWIHP
jgi:hypothetical protein